MQTQLRLTCLLCIRKGALKSTSNRGLQAALDFLVENEDKPVPADGGSAPAAAKAQGGDGDEEDEDELRAALGLSMAAPGAAAESSAGGSGEGGGGVAQVRRSTLINSYLNISRYRALSVPYVARYLGILRWPISTPRSPVTINLRRARRRFVFRALLPSGSAN